MNQQELIPGTNRDHSLSQFFTPPKLAAKLVKWAGIRKYDACVYDPTPDHNWRTMRVLEPSAGNGAIVRELVKAGAEVEAIEIDPRYYPELLDANAYCVDCPTDFLRIPGGSSLLGTFDLVCGNFPFHEDLQGEFTLHALKFAPRVCAIYPSNFYFSEKRIEFWKQVRPTRIANLARRPWEGATDYVALELVWRSEHDANIDTDTRVEWWTEAWD